MKTDGGSDIQLFHGILGPYQSEFVQNRTVYTLLLVGQKETKLISNIARTEVDEIEDVQGKLGT